TSPSGRSDPNGSPTHNAKQSQARHKDQRRTEKEIKNIERKIARLDEDKRALQTKLLNETDPDEAVRLHEQVTAIEKEVGQAEERWVELSDF
ncbi:MAG: ABC transporter C-terminal domain-containing protein, partial [Planctomycetota bacterium]